MSFPPFLLPFKLDRMGPSTGIEWIFLLTRQWYRLDSPSMLLHKSKACEKAALVDSRTYHTKACSQKIFCVNDIFPYREGLPVLNCNSQLKCGEFHKNSAPRKQQLVHPWSRWPHTFCNPHLISWSTCHQWHWGQLHLCDPLVVILEDNTCLHISTHWSVSLLIWGGLATSFPSYFLLPCKGAYIAVLESADKVFLCPLSFIWLLILLHWMLLARQWQQKA